eukprot:COSAG05_NODE_164_length_15364_cov_46.329731_8_plen_62_part_00
MEEIKSSVRPFKNKEQSHKSLSGDTTYYRIHLNSAHKEAHTSISLPCVEPIPWEFVYALLA